MPGIVQRLSVYKVNELSFLEAHLGYLYIQAI